MTIKLSLARFFAFFTGNTSVDDALASVSTAVSQLTKAKEAQLTLGGKLAAKGVALERAAEEAYGESVEAIAEAERAARIINRLNDLVA